MPILETDTFPLWSFGYMYTPNHDKPNKVMTSRGRTWQEAWYCVQTMGRSFLEPEKVGVCASVCIQHKLDYDKTHTYDWLNDAPEWLKRMEGAYHLIWDVPPLQPAKK